MLGAKFAPVAKIFTSIQCIGGGDGWTDLMPMRFRGQCFGIISGMWATGSASEPAIGGAFSQNASWVRSLNDGRNIESYQRATEMDRILSRPLCLCCSAQPILLCLSITRSMLPRSQ